MSLKEIKQKTEPNAEKKVEDKTVKELVQTMLDNLPDDITWERLHYHLGVVEAVYESLQEAKTNPGIPHEEMLKRVRPWR